VALSDIAYKDDTTSKSLRQFLEAENSKIIITNGSIKVEQWKGVDAIETPSFPALILNANEFNPRYSFSIDPGTADRIKFLSTYTGTQINAQERTDITKKSPDLRPAFHLNWLAEYTETSLDAVMLWLARLCADKFLSSIDSLEDVVKTHSQHLKIQHYKLATRQFLSFLWVFNSTFGGRGIGKDDGLNTVEWSGTLHAMYIAYTSESFKVFELLKEWAHESKDYYHPGWIVDAIDPSSLRSASHYADANTRFETMGKTPRDTIEGIFKCIYTRSGFPLTSDYVWLCSNWEAVRSYVPVLRGIVRKFEDMELNDTGYVGRHAK
jgi:hypothetical protein